MVQQAGITTAQNPVAVVTQEQLAAAILKLRPALRIVFVMAHVQGKSQEEIAEVLNLSPWRVQKRMTKALSTCRESLLSEGLMD